jgi:hypothetical protein
MTYIEDANGNPVNSNIAVQIRRMAREIWADFYRREIAPKKWSNMPMSMQDQYVYEMELKWEILKLCDNH